MMDKLEKILMPVANVLSKNKILSAIRDGFLVTVPITIVGSIFLLIANFPVQGFLDMMTSIFGQGWDAYLGRVSAIAFDCTALLSCLGIGYCYTREQGVENKIAGGIVALVSFLIITPQRMEVVVEGAAEAAKFNGLGFTFLGTAGMFLAMIVAIISVKLFCWATKRNLVIKLPDGVPPAVMDSFASLIPAAIAMTFFFVVGIVFSMTPYQYAHYFIYEILQAPLVGLGKLSGFEVIYQFLSTLFWFFGINGPAVTNTIFGPIHKALTLENYEAAAAGLEMTNIFTAGFSDFFCNFGGGGSTLGLVIMMAFLGKSNRLKNLGRLSLPAAIFGINEPIIFGLPIVLNPLMAIPFILTPCINTIIGYVATITGIMPITSGVQLPWTTPIVFSGYLVTGSVMGSIVQIVMLIVDLLIYYPFFKLLDKRYLEDESKQSDTVDELDDLSFDDLSLD
ncbi:MAG: PTS sugar transporter subunit IIC [Erysipelotrichaceae bacterium]|nr:PTS sugar transporter subunit IIC [Erysipelotrichaceae bacterium]